MKITAKVLDIGYDLIIELPTIKSNNLITEKFAHKFSSGITSNLARQDVVSGTAHTTSPNETIASLERKHKLPSRMNVREILNYDPDDDGIEDSTSSEPWNENPLPKESNILDFVHVEGEEKLQIRIREFLARFEDRFSIELRPEPAAVPPMELQVDMEK
jgi:hypothetical protein